MLAFASILCIENKIKTDYTYTKILYTELRFFFFILLCIEDKKTYYTYTKIFYWTPFQIWDNFHVLATHVTGTYPSGIEILLLLGPGKP